MARKSPAESNKKQTEFTIRNQIDMSRHTRSYNIMFLRFQRVNDIYIFHILLWLIIKAKNLSLKPIKNQLIFYFRLIYGLKIKKNFNLL